MNKIHEKSGALDASCLKLGALLGQGGQGSVWQVENLVWDDAPSVFGACELVYKQYRPAALQDINRRALELIPRFWEELDQRYRVRLLQWVAWPLATVATDGVLSGFVMPRIDSAFFFDRRLLSGEVKQEIAASSFLLNSHKFSRKVGVDVNGPQRCEILADLAEALNFIHERGIAVNDISPMNVLWSTAEECRAFLIDADSMMIEGRSATPHFETLDWSAPASTGTRLAQQQVLQANDVFKLALMTMRVLTGSQTLKNPAALSASLSDIKPLAEASLAEDPVSRPSAAEWIAPLHRIARSDPELPWLESSAIPSGGSAERKSPTTHKHAKSRQVQSPEPTAQRLKPSVASTSQADRTKPAHSTAHTTGTHGSSYQQQPQIGARPPQVKPKRRKLPREKKSYEQKYRLALWVIAALLVLSAMTAAIAIASAAESEPAGISRGRPPTGSSAVAVTPTPAAGIPTNANPTGPT